MIYIISATLVTKVFTPVEMWSHTTQMPTFILDSRIQGIVNVEQARQVAYKLLNPLEDKDITVDMEVVESDPIVYFSKP